MKTAIYTKSESSPELVERPIPEPGVGEALIRVHRCGVCGSDFAMTSGSPFDYPEGTALGHEYAGEVVALGAGCKNLALGDRVTALPLSSCGQCEACLAGTPMRCPQFAMMTGGFGEYVVIQERMAFKLPDNLSYEHGALIEPLASSLRGVRKLSIEPSTKIAVLGAGTIAAGAIFWAHHLGARDIVAIARSRTGEALTQTVGASDFLQTGDKLSERVAKALGGVPDIVIEGVGVPGMLQQAIDLVRPEGTVLSLGGCNVGDTILPVVAMAKEVSLLFSMAYSVEDFRYTIETLASKSKDLNDIADAMISDVIPLEALPERFTKMRTASSGGKVMVNPALKESDDRSESPT
ncbi:MAG: alcohol dehydrogenase catalytic domain-containing protein [Tissierellales bacterium]